MKQLDRHNVRLNAFITIKTIEGRKEGALKGLTFGIKDMICTEGVRTTAGSKILADFVPDADAEVVRRIREEGGTILGKTNTHEFAAGPTNTSSIGGPARNPVDPERISGGSSGGSAVAVASEMVDVGIGTDTGGSVRVPAALCGVIGFKPTTGIISNDGIIPLSWTLDTVGVMAMKIASIRMVLNVLISSRNKRAITSKLRNKPRLGIFLFADDEASTALKPAINMLSSEFEVTEVDFPLLRETGSRARRIITLAEAALYHKEWFDTRADDYFPDVRRLLTIGRRTPAIDYVEASRLAKLMGDEYAEGFKKIDAVVSPTTKIPAPRIDAVTGNEIDYRDPLISNAELFNLVSAPSISIPGGNSNGLPLGLMLSGVPRNDGALLDVAERVIAVLAERN